MKIQKVVNTLSGICILFESYNNIKRGSYIGCTIKGYEYFFEINECSTNNSKFINYEAYEITDLNKNYNGDIRNLIGAEVYVIREGEKILEINNKLVF